MVELLSNAALMIAAGVTLAPIIMFCLECLAAFLPGKASDLSTASRPRVAVLIPAHDEEQVLEDTLRAVSPALADDDRLLVVADNCTDRTAELAHVLGAEVYERIDPEHRGKGYALKSGIQHLVSQPPEVLIVLDADCLVEADTVDRLARLAFSSGRPVQARNLTDRNGAAGDLQVVSLLANRITNLIRPLGLLRLGAPCRLMGTGMAIPWRMAEHMPLVGDSLVEDLQLGIDLALQGKSAFFCPEAGVTSCLPQGAAFVTQRTRWEHGHLQAAVSQIPRLLAASLKQRRIGLAAMAWDLSIPPMTLLAAGWILMLIVSIAAGLVGLSWLPAVLLSVGGVAMAVSIAVAWAGFCRRQVPLRGFVAVPRYIVRKWPVYARLVFHRQHAWVRTERQSVRSPPRQS